MTDFSLPIITFYIKLYFFYILCQYVKYFWTASDILIRNKNTTLLTFQLSIKSAKSIFIFYALVFGSKRLTRFFCKCEIGHQQLLFTRLWGHTASAVGGERCVSGHCGFCQCSLEMGLLYGVSEWPVFKSNFLFLVRPACGPQSARVTSSPMISLSQLLCVVIGWESM